MFSSSVPEDGEHVTDFITALYALSKTCEYGQLKDELIRVGIVVRVRDKRLSTELQLQNDLTLERRTAVLAKQTEVVRRQQDVLR